MSKDNLRPYKTGGISKWPTGLKVFLLKTWTAGMLFYFIFMSMEVFSVLSAPEDRWLLIILVLIILNEYFINLLIKSMELDDVVRSKHAMFIKGKYSMVYNIFYIATVTIVTIFIGGLIIGLGISLSKLTMPAENAMWEPFTFGILYYLTDTILIFLVNKIKPLFKKKENRSES